MAMDVNVEVPWLQSVWLMAKSLADSETAIDATDMMFV